MGPVPRHVAFIMDGNRRWAKERGLSVDQGHLEGARALERVIEALHQRGVTIVTAFGFSTENWARSPYEINSIMRLLSRRLSAYTDTFIKNKVRFRYIGRRDRLDTALKSIIEASEAHTKTFDTLAFNLAFDYGGKWDLTEAIKSIATKIQEKAIDPKQVDEATINAHMSLANLPDPDILVRSSGQQRLSNFMLWNLAYTELLFLHEHWPQFDKAVVTRILDAFAARQRNFGK